MLGRNGEVNGHLTIASGILRTLNQVLLDSRASLVAIAVEEDQTLRFRTVSQALLDDSGNGLLVGSVGGQQLAQLLAKCELINVLNQLVDVGTTLALVHKFEQRLEHTCCGTRRRHKLHNTLCTTCRVELSGILRSLLCREFFHATIVGRRSSLDIEEGESTTEVFDLMLNGFGRQTVCSDLLQILFSKHWSK